MVMLSTVSDQVWQSLGYPWTIQGFEETPLVPWNPKLLLSFEVIRNCTKKQPTTVTQCSSYGVCGYRTTLDPSSKPQ